MRQQLRLRVLLPVAVLGLLGAGFGAFAMGGPATPASIPVSNSGAADTRATDTGAIGAGTNKSKQAPAPAPAPAPASAPAPAPTPTPAPSTEPKPESKTTLKHELEANRIVVVVFHTRGSDLDAAAVREARAGAAAAEGGFLAVDVKNERDVADLAAEYEVLGAPTVLVLGHDGALRSRFDGYVDRETVAQAVTNARE
jgi:hypothetical protein